MARIPRKYLIETADVGVYHCINRCVRRAFLCGTDRVSGKCFDHRKEWIQDRLEFLAGVFGIDVMGFAVLSNHLHLVLRNRPDVVSAWTDDEVARRWWRLFPSRREADGSASEATREELLLVTGNAARLAEVRSRLSSVSWFMRCVAEPIARQSNREDECTGRFWEGRYRCQPLLDESAVLACMAYVDLNPIRAKIATTPETSQFTSVFERIMAARDAVGTDSLMDSSAAGEATSEVAGSDVTVTVLTQQSTADPRTCSDEGSGVLISVLALETLPIDSQSPVLESCGSLLATTKQKSEHPTPACESGAISTTFSEGKESGDQSPHFKARQARGAWLSPLTLAREVADERGDVPACRASNKGCLPISLNDYLQLLDWTGRQMRRGKRSSIPADAKRSSVPADVAPILQRLKISDDGWFHLVHDFSRLFRRAAGTPTTLANEATRRGHRWLKGIGASRATFA